MDCPLCKTAMITLELNRVEIDYCTECAGIWLDAGELEQLLGDSKETEELLRSFKEDTTTKEKARKCPICGKKMKKVLVDPENSAVLIDKCGKGHGLWFDKGELNEVFAAAKFPQKHKVQELMEEIFKA